MRAAGPRVLRFPGNGWILWPRRGVRPILAMLAFGVIMASVALGTSERGLLPACQLHANHILDEFCFRTTVTVTKGTTGNLTDYPIALQSINGRGFVTGRKLGTYGWDLYPVNQGNSEIHALVQDIEPGDDVTTWWIRGDVIGSASVTYDLFSGHSDAQRNQAMGFFGSDLVTVTDHADLDPGDNFDVIVEAETDTPDQDGDLVDKVTGLTGYRLAVSSTSTGRLVATVGSGAATSSLEVPWTGGAQRIRMRFDAGATNDLDVSFYSSSTGAWVSQGSMNTGYASVAANAAAFVIGDTFTGLISEVELRDNVGGTYRKVAHWGFNPIDIDQTTADTDTPWNFTGTVDDLIGPHDGSYTLVRDQSAFSVTVSPTAFNFSDPSPQAEDDLADLVGSVGSFDFSTTTANPPWRNVGTLGAAIAQAVDGTELAPTAFKFLIVLGLIVFAGGTLFIRTGSEAGFAIVAIVLFGIAAAIGFLPPWWAVIPGFVILALWFTVGRTRA